MEISADNFCMHCVAGVPPPSLHVVVFQSVKHHTKRVGSSGNASHLYSGGVQILAWQDTDYPNDILWSSSLPPGKYWDGT